MSYPNQGQPEHHVPDSGQPGQPPFHGNMPPPYRTPAPVTGTAPPATRVPGTVIVAAVVAILTIAPYGLFSFVFLSAASDNYVVDSDREASGVAAFVDLVSAGLLIWGAVAALRGRTRKILFFASLAALILVIIEFAALLAIFYSHKSGTNRDVSLEGVIPVSMILLTLGPLVVIFLIAIQSSVEFLRARRGSKI